MILTKYYYFFFFFSFWRNRKHFLYSKLQIIIIYTAIICTIRCITPCINFKCLSHIINKPRSIFYFSILVLLFVSSSRIDFPTSSILRKKKKKISYNYKSNYINNIYFPLTHRVYLSSRIVMISHEYLRNAVKTTVNLFPYEQLQRNNLSSNIILISKRRELYRR